MCDCIFSFAVREVDVKGLLPLCFLPRLVSKAFGQYLDAPLSQNPLRCSFMIRKEQLQVCSNTEGLKQLHAGLGKSQRAF